MASNSTEIEFDYSFHKPFIYSVVGMFTLLGLWGNINVVILHLRKKNLLNKYGTLLSLLSFCQAFCLCFEWVGILYSLTVEKITRHGCFSLLAPYVFLNSMQTGLLATISLDLLISVTFPIRHRVATVNTYIFYISIPTISYGAITVALGALYLDDDLIPMCNPPSSLAPNVNQIWYTAAMIAGCITIINYVITYSWIYYKSRTGRDPIELEKRALRSITVILFIFVFTRYIGTVVSSTLRFFHVHQAVITLYQSYNVFFACICYSQNYYVCITTSSEYRRLLFEQFFLFSNRTARTVHPLASFHQSKSHLSHSLKPLSQPA
ncbi:unnamed protein product [Auanema sp. JU1783]|nr:unnamed protein product [Auanema sp. JU1783]